MFINFNCFVLLVLCIAIESKPLDDSVKYSDGINSDEKKNHQISQLKKIENFDNRISSLSTRKGERNILNLGFNAKTTDDLDTTEDDIEDITPTEPVDVNDDKKNTTTSTTNTNILTTILEAFIHKLKFTPQTFFQDRLGLFKEALDQLRITLPNNTPKPKQILNTNGLIHLAGLDNNGFYTNRLQPAGFLGGNGWFANKGGLLGGPGAILSTGPILTDYPTSYKKKK